MKVSNLVYAAVGYPLGTQAGRDRYETIVRAGRRVTGSQTVQATAGVLQAGLEAKVHQARTSITTRLNQRDQRPGAPTSRR